jgi:membrane-associated phospholipid phosphatase
MIRYSVSKATILFFAADPLSAPPAGGLRLQLDRDIRGILEKVRAAKLRDALMFDFRLAARADDLIQALNEVSPRVVHFSGHGSSEGVVLEGRDGGPQIASAAALEGLFRIFRGDIRVVVLNACFSLPQAEAIAVVVGCAIGTRKEISDDAAIAFGASFYRALAFGRSVQTAFDQARVALTLDHPGEEGTPQLIAGPGVDPARVFVVRGGRSRRWIGAAVMIVLAILVAYVAYDPNFKPAPPGNPLDSAAVFTDSNATFPSPGEAQDTVLARRRDENPPASQKGSLDSPVAVPPASDSPTTIQPPRSSPSTVEPRSQPASASASGSVVERLRSGIGADRYKEYEVAITGTGPCRLRGRVETVEGGARDIDVLVLDGDALGSFRQNRRYTPVFQARRTSEVALDVPLPGPGQYHLVISNRFSAFTGKVVLLEEVRWECAEGGSNSPE